MGQLKAEVFKVAARRIQMGQDEYTCNAVRKAVYEVYSKENYYRRSIRATDHSLAWQKTFGPFNKDGSYSARKEDRHGFWNRDGNPRRQAKRQQALLKMAEKIESGT